VDFEPNEDFERELRQAFERRPAPPGLRRKLMARRRVQRLRHPFVIWQRLAASILLIAALAGGVAGGLEWRNREERRKDEAARQQVMKALRITAHALNQMNARLAAHSHAAQD
jgi:hypothetical protein